MSLDPTQIEFLLSQRADGTLSAEEMRQVEAALAADPALRENAARYARRALFRTWAILHRGSVRLCGASRLRIAGGMLRPDRESSAGAPLRPWRRLPRRCCWPRWPGGRGPGVRHTLLKHRGHRKRGLKW